MLEQSKEARILLAIEALQSNSKLSVCKAATIYNVSSSSLCDRMNDKTTKIEIQ